MSSKILILILHLITFGDICKDNITTGSVSKVDFLMKTLTRQGFGRDFGVPYFQTNTSAPTIKDQGLIGLFHIK